MQPTLSAHPADRLARARRSLEGLSLGDAFGEQFFRHEGPAWIRERRVPPEPWRYTDDTEMALSIYAVLRDCGEIVQDRLSLWFAEKYDPRRGYGPAMHRLLPAIRLGVPWAEGSRALFAGSGSFGNGGAMRSAPIGAFFADDLDAAAANAARSAEVTHAHPEGVAGAVAVALGAAVAAREVGTATEPPARLLSVADRLPAGQVRAGVERAAALSPRTPILQVALELGSGVQITAQDTVPFALWCAAHNAGDFEAAVWAGVSGFGDMDTVGAIVGGIVAAGLPDAALPAAWQTAREPLPDWIE